MLSQSNVRQSITKERRQRFGSLKMRDHLYTLLDHQQSLLQNYRSLTVMFQTFLIAIAGILLTLINNKQTYTDLFFINYIIICLIGIFTTFGLLRTCNIRESYVDAIQELIYAIERKEISIKEDFPILTTLKFIHNIDEVKNWENIDVYKIIIKAKK